jgi:hypothetical protein
MAFTKAQLEALKNSQLASNQPINAATHRAFVQNLIDELYDAQSRGNLLAGVQDSGATVAGDEILVIRSGVAYLIPASLFGTGISFDDLNGIVIVDPQDGDLLSYNALTDSWQNLPNTFVPYANATASVDLGEFGLRAGFVRFDTTPTGTPTDQGTVSWDVDNETLDVVLNGYTMKVGEDLFYPVKNQTGASIPKGTAVQFNGTVGASGRLLIAPFLANGSLPSSRFMGVTAETIADGEDGKVLWFGRLRGINTNAFNEGDILYASTTVAGGYQTTLPTPPNNVISVAAVVTKSINQGTLFVRPQIEMFANVVTTNTAQSISAIKTFLTETIFSNWVTDENAYDRLAIDFGEGRGFGYDQFKNEIFLKGTVSVPVKLDGDAPTDSLIVLQSGNLQAANIPTGVPTTYLGLTPTGEFRTTEVNPRLYVFNMAANGAPDVSAGGAVTVQYSPSASFTTLATGDVAKMVIKGKIQTRNAANLITSIGAAMGSGATFGLSSLGWNWSNANVGDFTLEMTNLRTATGWRHKIDLAVDIFDGTTTAIRLLETTSTGITETDPSINGILTVTFAEANAANSLILISGIVEVYKATQ